VSGMRISTSRHSTRDSTVLAKLSRGTPSAAEQRNRDELVMLLMLFESAVSKRKHWERR
jgi:hypothetical protein